MSADPFRDIVKQYAHLYRDSEECRVKNYEIRKNNHIEWKKFNDFYEKVMTCLHHTESYMKSNVEYVEAPVYCSYLDLIATCFFGGGITKCKDWQKTLLGRVQSVNLPVRVYNPRRNNFNVENTSESEIQIVWERCYLNFCDILVFYFSEETLCPITLLELGGALERNLHTNPNWPDRKQKILVYCEPNYQRKFDVTHQINLVKRDSKDNQFVYIYDDYEQFFEGLIDQIKTYNDQYKHRHL